MTFRSLGVMTGTSCDGLDVACIDIDPQGWSPLWNASVSYPSSLRKTVLSFQKTESLHTSHSWLELHRNLGDWYGKTIHKIIQSHKDKPDIIANHGQTLAHFPEKSAKGMTLQLGDGSRIAAATGISVVHQFREGDMAAGGQGAPLVPLFHRMIAQQLGDTSDGISIHNLGGISNLTYLGPDDLILAFDTGPGNIWIDAATNQATHGRTRIDRNGKRASKGHSDPRTVKSLLKHPFFSKAIPKSTGRDDFPDAYLFSKAHTRGNDLIASTVEVTTQSIAYHYQKWIVAKGLPLKTIFLCGGGAKNPAILKSLREKMPQIEIEILSNWGLDAQFIEAQAFAVYGFLSLMGEPLGGSWTGAKKFGPPGHIVPGKNWLHVLSKIQGIV